MAQISHEHAKTAKCETTYLKQKWFHFWTLMTSVSYKHILEETYSERLNRTRKYNIR